MGLAFGRYRRTFLEMNDRPTALVTGGGKRVGRAVVERFLTAGYDVAFTFRSSEREAVALATDYAARGNVVIPIQTDLAASRDLDRLVFRCRERLGNLNVLVNCASMYLPDDLPTGASADLQQSLLSVNTIAPAWLMSALSAELIAARGCVVNFLDLLAEKPRPKYSAYCASKAALHSLTLSYARKLAPHVRVNGIAPGVIDWPDDMPDADREAYLQKVPLGRAGTPQEAADVVQWLATAAPYVTGHVIRLDGGRSLV